MCMMRFSSIFVENLLRLMISLVDSMQKHVMHVHKCHMACISASHISHMACISACFTYFTYGVHKSFTCFTESFYISASL